MWSKGTILFSLTLKEFRTNPVLIQCPGSGLVYDRQERTLASTHWARTLSYVKILGAVDVTVCVSVCVLLHKGVPEWTSVSVLPLPFILNNDSFEHHERDPMHACTHTVMHSEENTSALIQYMVWGRQCGWLVWNVTSYLQAFTVLRRLILL